jgi:hypothetical protein
MRTTTATTWKRNKDADNNDDDQDEEKNTEYHDKDEGEDEGEDGDEDDDVFFDVVLRRLPATIGKVTTPVTGSLQSLRQTLSLFPTTLRRGHSSWTT